jgi:tRNA-splicing ligase RtcB
VISPGGVGYDINCGVRLLVSLASVKEVKPYLEDIASRLYANCPSGVGSHGQLRLSNTELDQGLHEGSRWMMDEGYASRADLDRTEEFGRIPGADAAFVSDRARERGRNQLGTLGAGNHFIEVDRVAEVYDQTTAARLGHQICQDYVSRSLHPAVGLGLSSGSVSISSSF